jgi:TRAP-type uncharacterized transport system fused permease subunit
MRLCSIAYIVPFLFVFSPSLLLYGSWTIVTLSVVTAVIGSMLLGIGLVGFLFRRIGVVKRAWFVLAAIALLIPVTGTGQYAELTWGINAVGLVMAIALTTTEWLARRVPKGSHSVSATSEGKAT